MDDSPAFFRDTTADGKTAPTRTPAAGDKEALKPRSQEQSGLTMVATIKAGEVDALRALLEEIGADIEGNSYIPFRALTTVHYCRWVVLPASPDVGVLASVAFESNYDGDLDAHLAELVREGSKGLVAIYRHCEGWPGDDVDAAGLEAFLRGISLPYAAFYIGHRGLSQRWIQNDIRVREAIQDYLADEQKKPGWPPPPAELRRGIQKHLAGIPGLSTDAFQRELPSWSEVLPQIVGASVLGLAFLPVLLGAAAIYAVVLRRHEARDRSDPLHTYFPITNLIDLEDKVIQNQLTHLVNIRPGRFRLLTLKGVLWAINLLARYEFNNGNLGGIPSIHFARWAIVDGGKRLLFFSNFDGSWENYLGDFIDKASRGLTGVWSNTSGFPPTEWLVNAGATHEGQFKQWTRAHQLPTQVWYAAYGHATVTNVLDNAEIRCGVQGERSGEALNDWLGRL